MFLFGNSCIALFNGLVISDMQILVPHVYCLFCYIIKFDNTRAYIREKIYGLNIDDQNELIESDGSSLRYEKDQFNL